MSMSRMSGAVVVVVVGISRVCLLTAVGLVAAVLTIWVERLVGCLCLLPTKSLSVESHF